MNSQAWIQLVVFLLVLAVVAWPIGKWLAAVADGRLPRWLAPIRGIENGLYKLAGVDAGASMGWKPYALGLLAFNVLGVIAVYALQRLQGVLPLNPQGMAAVNPDSSFNTAISFVTNTDWQGYGGESTMSYLTQMLALTVQNFFSAASGIAVVYALIRGFAARSSGLIGNVWVDLTRVTLYVLLPLSLGFAVALVGQGVIQNFDAYKDVTTLEVNAYQAPKNGPDGQPLKDDKDNPVLEPAKTPTQSIAMGPVASQEAIKLLGTNGGGFFNANSAHPFENPTPLSNFLQMLSIFLIPAALVFAFGRLVGDMRQGCAVLAAMTLLFVASVLIVTPPEQGGNPQFAALGIDQAQSTLQPGGNMEGKEARFGVTADDRQHPGIPWQEDRGVRHEDGLDRDPRHADPGAHRYRARRVARRRHIEHRESRRARLLGNSVRAQLGGQQQRQRVSGPVGQHTVLQHAARGGDVVRPLRGDRAGAGDRRQPRGQEAPRGDARHAAHARSAVRRAAARLGAARRPAELRARARARAGGRALHVVVRQVSRTANFFG